MSKLRSWKTVSFLCFLYAATAITSPAQTGCSVAAPCFNSVSFDGTDNAVPEYGPPLAQGRDGNLYGTTLFGGIGPGTVFKITAEDKLTTIHNFSGLDGVSPYAGLALGTDGKFYGTTSQGGLNNFGTVFKITTGGVLTVLHSFQDGTDGASPVFALVQATDGNFYGTTPANAPANQNGTVFRVTSTDNLTTLYTFQNGTDGTNPVAALIQATNGNFYGMTCCWDDKPGTIFEVTPKGKLTTLHTFGTDGTSPAGTLVQAADGNFYGTTEQGGANCDGVGCGTVFKMTAGGKLTTLYSFCSQTGCTDGSMPIGGLVQATDGNFYGTTSQGGIIGSCGNYGCGTVFKLSPEPRGGCPSGSNTGNGWCETTLHSFDSTDGATPQAGLMQATNGKFYGTTTLGGTTNNGTVFSLSVGLGPFVEAVTYSGKVGNTIEFLGQGFTSSSAVFFHGTRSLTVKVSLSGTYLTATVPNGATTGFVTLTTSSGTLKSNKIFRVVPQITSFNPTSGPPGTSVIIRGISLKQTTKVTFGGVPALSYTVNSDMQVTVTVPAGAQTGKITVTTPGGIATSSGTFTVT